MNKQEFIKRHGYLCQKCGISEWHGQKLILELHHIDGNRQNNVEENFELLCPNCHSLTSNFNIVKKAMVSDKDLLKSLMESSSIYEALLKVGLSTAGTQYTRANRLIREYGLTKYYKKSIETAQNYCAECGAPVSKGANLCNKCRIISNRVVQDRPTREELKEMIRTTPFITIGKNFNVSDNAIRKWCIAYDLPSRAKEIKSYSAEEWALL